MLLLGSGGRRRNRCGRGGSQGGTWWCWGWGLDRDWGCGRLGLGGAFEARKGVGGLLVVERDGLVVGIVEGACAW